MFDALNDHFGDDVEWGMVAYPPFIINVEQGEFQTGHQTKFSFEKSQNIKSLRGI